MVTDQQVLESLESRLIREFNELPDDAPDGRAEDLLWRIAHVQAWMMEVCPPNPGEPFADLEE